MKRENRVGRGTRREFITLLFVLATASLMAADAGNPAAAGVTATPILTDASTWRWHITLRTPAVSVEAMKAAGKVVDKPVPLPIRLAWNPIGDVENIQTAAPAEDWKALGFDDSDWPRASGPFEKAISTALLCLRGRFMVTDPAAAGELSLAMKFRGGAVIYLNGREAARVHMPAGPVTAETPAEAYPDEAYIGADGKAIPPIQKATDDDKARMARRERAAGPIKLATDALQKGVNVLAIELHRSPFHPSALTWWSNPGDFPYGRISHWSTIGLEKVLLTATGAGVEPNVTRGTGKAVWPVDIHERLSLDSAPDAIGSTQPVRLIGARNGFYAAQIGAWCSDSLGQVRAAVGDLVGHSGAAAGKKIPASSVRIRYLVQGNPTVSLGEFFDGALDQAPNERKPARRTHFAYDRMRKDRGWPVPAAGALQPIWITVAVPKEAPAGVYRGEVTVTDTTGSLPSPALAPLELEVVDWTLPSVSDFRAHAGIFQSPTTLSMHYNLPLWSEEHWKLMDRSFGLLSQVGNKLLNVPISEQTQFGDDESIVRFVKKADGTLEPDFAVFERYLKLATKHLPRISVVSMQVWHAGAWQPRKADQKNTVTVIDPQTGKRVESWQVPVFGTEASAAFWKPVLEGVKKRLTEVGLGQAMAIGILSDGTAPPEVFRMFEQAAPGIGWTRGCHSVTHAKEPYAVSGASKVVYHEFCYGGSIADPGKHLPEWNLNGPGTDWRRGHRDWFSPVSFRRLPERGLYSETRGFGRLGLDLWPVKIEGGGKPQIVEIFNRYPHSSVGGHGDPTTIALSHPSPEGPVSTARLELLREGLQEAEAVLFISGAMENQAEKLGPDLAAQCRKILVERVETCRMLEGVDGDFYAGWQHRSRRLYEAAAQVQGKLRSGG